MQMKNLYNSIYIEEYEVELDQIPDMAGFSHYVEDYGGEPPYVKYCYFGDRNTTVKDNIWSKNAMGICIYECAAISPNYVIYQIEDGDCKIPQELYDAINQLINKNQLDDVRQIVCGISEFHGIMFMYLSHNDMHYFFECKE